MPDDKLFHFLVARVQAREAVSLSLATITSSASLILIALVFSIEQEIQSLSIILGILFPLIALFYIETTNRGIHAHDHLWIRRLVAEEHKHNEKNRSEKETEKILVYKKNRIFKVVLVRLIIILPVLGWFFIIDNLLVENYFVGIGLSIILLGIVFALYSHPEIKELLNNDSKRSQITL